MSDGFQNPSPQFDLERDCVLMPLASLRALHKWASHLDACADAAPVPNVWAEDFRLLAQQMRELLPPLPTKEPADG